MPKKSAHKKTHGKNLTPGLLLLAFATAFTFFTATVDSPFNWIIVSGTLSLLALVLLIVESRS